MRSKITVNEEVLKQSYSKHHTIRGVAEDLGLTEKTAERRLKEIGLSNPNKKYYCNDQFFDELNERSLYWLGFIATDGNVYSRGPLNKVLTISLSTLDRCLLETFRSHISSNYPIHDYIKRMSNVKFKKQEYPYSVISISSTQIFDRLAEYNIIPAKTHIYEFPQQLIDHAELQHFIRGCIDGDGSEGLRFNDEKNPNQVRVSFSGNPKFVRQVYDLIKEKCCLSKNSGTLHAEKTWAKFEFAAHEDIKKIKAFLYDGATIYLERKYDNIAQIDYVIENSKLFIIDAQDLQNKYNELGTFAATAKEFNVDNSTVKRKMDRMELQYKDLSDYRHNDVFFSNENGCEKQFYAAGYLATMSSIRHYSDNKCAITITNKNVDEVELIKSLLDTTAPIHGNKYYSISVFNERIISDLERFGITSDKLKGYTIPEWMINHAMLNHFLRGCIEGKGCVSNKSQLLLELSGAEPYLEALREIFASKCGLATTNSIRARKGKEAYRLTYSGKAVAPIIQFLYKDATVFLPRKKEIVQHLL